MNDQIPNTQQPQILVLPAKKLAGVRIRTTLAENKTRELWQGFSPRIKEIAGNLNTGRYSVEIYDQVLSFENFNPHTMFEKWAAVEVNDFERIPDGMEKHTLQGGMYAVFIHKGPASTFPQTAQYIFGVWLPQSEYELDDREHFEIMGDGYNPLDANSEEEICIPIKARG